MHITSDKNGPYHRARFGIGSRQCLREKLWVFVLSEVCSGSIGSVTNEIQGSNVIQGEENAV